jgi:protocatechuate 3,4-dioxygenase beta subunit
MNSNRWTETPPLTRRRLLALGGSLVGGAVALVACGDDDDAEPAASTASTQGNGGSSTTAAADASDTTGAETTPTQAAPTETSESIDLTSGTPSTTVFTAADFAALGTCTVMPELTEGPFPTIDQIERRDITEQRPGLPLRVGVQVVDEACSPIPGANVEIWHCDIDGDYSAYADGYTSDDDGEGTTFLRGSQVANDEGIVEFLTLYPGWYGGRAVHIHAKVHIDESTVLTTQFLFDDSLNSEVMATEPYAAFGEPDTTNASDGVAADASDWGTLLLTVGDDAAIAGRRGLIVVGVDPEATSQGGGARP